MVRDIQRGQSKRGADKERRDRQENQTAKIGTEMQTNRKKNRKRGGGWRDESVVKNICCSWRGLGFGF